jgi:hypothetical protein
LIEVSEVLTASITRVIIALMMEALSISETLVSFYETIWHNIPEDSHLHNRRRENLKSHQELHNSNYSHNIIRMINGKLYSTVGRDEKYMQWFRSENLNGHLNVEGRTILKCMVKMSDGRVWTGFICLRVRPVLCSFDYSNGRSGSGFS